MSSDRQAYHRLETDAEFRDRIARDKGRRFYYSGADLDDTVWNHFEMQRRIIFVPAP